MVFYSLFAGAFRSLWFGHLDIFTFISSQITEMSGTHQLWQDELAIVNEIKASLFESMQTKDDKPKRFKDLAKANPKIAPLCSALEAHFKGTLNIMIKLICRIDPLQ